MIEGIVGIEVIATVSDVVEATESVGDRDRLTRVPEAPVETKRIRILPAATIVLGSARTVTRAVGMREIGSGTVETEDANLDAMTTIEDLPGAREICSTTDRGIAIAVAGEKEDGQLVLHRGRGNLRLI